MGGCETIMVPKASTGYLHVPENPSEKKHCITVTLKLKCSSTLVRSRAELASFPGSPKALAEEKKRKAWYQPCTHAQVLPDFG